MRISWRAREYERTCADCGYAWRVPRSAADEPIAGFGSAPRGRPVSLGGINPVTPGPEPEVASSEAVSEVAAAYGHYPKRGAERYTQLSARS